MTNAEKAQAVAKLFDLGRDKEAFDALRYMLDTRPWPEWLTRTARDIDSVTKDRPVNG